MNTKSFYSKASKLSRIVQHIRSLPPDSDDSELSEDDNNDDEYIQPLRNDAASSSSEEEEIEQRESGVSEDEDQSEVDADAPSSSASSQTRNKCQQKRTNIWKVDNLDGAKYRLFTGDDQLPGDILKLKTPIQFFHRLFTTDLEKMIVEQSNLYATQVRPNRPLQLTENELQQFLGTVLWMSLIKLPSTRRYWSARYKVDVVSESLSVNRWEEIKRFLHFVDNANEEMNDKLRKIRLVISAIRQQLLLIPREESLCVDEQIVPFKGKSSLKMYNPRKPHKWGYKIYVLSGISGFSYDLEVYTGEKHTIDPTEVDIGTCDNIVVRLCRSVPSAVNHHIFFDNYFTSLNLLIQLEARQIQSVGTVRLNRLHALKGPSEKDMKRTGRGTYSECVTTIDDVDVCCVKWYDNKLVSLVSTFVGSEPVGTVRRWSKSKKMHKEIPCPNTIKTYNKHMGGVDLLDSLMGLYRIHVRSKKYYLRIFFHVVDIAVVNSWLLYRRSIEQRNGQQAILPLAEFKAEIAESLCKQSKPVGRKRRANRISNSSRS